MVHSLFKLFLWTGSEWVLWVLTACSLLALTVALDRWRHLRGQERVGGVFWKDFGQEWLEESSAGNWRDRSTELAQKYPCVETRLMNALARHPSRNATDALERATESFISAERIRLEKNLAVLGTLGNSAPFIGLLGTVLGIIRAFYDLNSATSTGAGLASVSGGLAEALVTTAVGLLVALPCALAFNFFQRKIKAIHSRTISLSGVLIAASESSELEGQSQWP